MALLLDRDLYALKNLDIETKGAPTMERSDH